MKNGEEDLQKIANKAEIDNTLRIESYLSAL